MRHLLEMLRKPDPLPKVECGEGYCVLRVIFHGIVTDEAVTRITEWLEAAQVAGAKAIVIELTTKGGSLDAGFALVGAIENVRVPTYCVADYEVLSIGFAILQACSHRLMTKRTQLLIHEPRLDGTRGGVAQEMKNVSENLRTATRAFVEHCQRRTKPSVATYLAHIEGGKEWFMNWEEALKLGVVDRTVPNGRWVEETLASQRRLPQASLSDEY